MQNCYFRCQGETNGCPRRTNVTEKAKNLCECRLSCDIFGRNQNITNCEGYFFEIVYECLENHIMGKCFAPC